MHRDLPTPERESHWIFSLHLGEDPTVYKKYMADKIPDPDVVLFADFGLADNGQGKLHIQGLYVDRRRNPNLPQLHELWGIKPAQGNFSRIVTKRQRSDYSDYLESRGTKERKKFGRLIE